MDLNTLNCKGPLNAGVDQLIERYVVTGSAVTSKTFLNLAGDTDLVYYIKIKHIYGAANCFISIYLNNDTGSNYGLQAIRGANAGASAFARTSNAGLWPIEYALASADHVGLYGVRINAKSGAVRTAISSGVDDVTGTTPIAATIIGHSWSNTANEITSIAVSGVVTNGLGVGSEIELWCRRGVAS